MKIAHICQSYPPMVSGASLIAQRLATHQGAHGHAVLVLAASEQGPAYRSVAQGVVVQRLRSHHNPFRKGQRFVLQPGPVLLRALRDFAPDVVHLHDPLAMGLPGLAAARQLGVPVVLTLHALPEVVGAYAPAMLRHPLTAALWRLAGAFAARCNALAAPSAAAAEAVRQQTGHAPHVISNGVDLRTFNPEPAVANEAAVLRQRYGLAEGVPVVITVGRLDPDKKVDLVLRALARVLPEAPAQLLVVGDGTQRSALMDLCGQLGLAQRVHVAGYVSPVGDLPGLYRLAEAFVIASETETEGMVVVEAAAAGLPIVAVRATSLPGLVDDGRTGWLVRPGDPEDMAARLRELLGRPTQARAMGLAGRDKMAQAYSFENTWRAYERLYRRLAGESTQDLQPLEQGRAEPQAATRPRASG